MEFRDLEMEHDDGSAQSAKLFVGQIPKDINEDILSTYFEEFGTMKELSVIRDTASGMSRGKRSCFSYAFTILLCL